MSRQFPTIVRQNTTNYDKVRHNWVRGDLLAFPFDLRRFICLNHINKIAKYIPGFPKSLNHRYSHFRLWYPNLRAYKGKVEVVDVPIMRKKKTMTMTKIPSQKVCHTYGHVPSKEEDADHDQDLFTKDLLHLWSWSSRPSDRHRVFGGAFPCKNPEKLGNTQSKPSREF